MITIYTNENDIPQQIAKDHQYITNVHHVAIDEQGRVQVTFEADVPVELVKLQTPFKTR